MPHISKRKWIKWSTDAESEPTSTLVLTSDTNNFIDIRVLTRDPRNEAAEAREGLLPLSRLDWAFAGTSTSNELPDQTGSDRRKTAAAWHHWIDSRTTEPELVKDSGEMVDLGNGESLESGTMVNPEHPNAGAVPYEELWQDVLAVPTSKLPRASLEGVPGNTPVRISVVIQLEDAQDRARGMVVRVGQYVQGMFKLGKQSGKDAETSTTVERWEWSDGLEPKTTVNDGGEMVGASKHGWQRQLRIGEYWLPCGFAMAVEEGKVNLRQEIVFGEFKWKVVELSYF